MLEELWKDINGYEGYYQVSNLGNVKSLDRYIQIGDKIVFRKGKECTKYLTTDKYYQVKLSKYGISKRYSIHCLVAKHFIENKNYQDGWEVNHIDCNRINNNVENLEWVSHKENIIHSAKLGRMKHYGKDNPNYGNRKLHQKYLENPEMSKLQSRSGAQNGRARAMILVEPNGNEKSFGYIRECSKYLIENNLIKSICLETLSTKISKLLNSDKSYYNYKFKTF